MWERETDFEELLVKGIKKTTKSSIDEVVALAIDEEKWGYKHVVGLLKKAMAKGKKDRIKVLYIISSICRKSRSQLGAKDKYAQRFTPVLPSIAKLLAEAPAEDLVQADKVLQTWRRDSTFDSYALAEFEEILKKGRASTASNHEKRKAEKQESSQGPPGANGDMDIDFGMSFEDIAAPPLPFAPPPSRIASSFMSQEPLPASVEQPTKKARGSRWGVPIPPPAQPQLSVPAPAPQVNNSISRAPFVHPEPPHPRWEPLVDSAESASQQQASIAFARPSSGGPPAQPPVSSSQPLERINQEDAMKRVRELAAEFMARASKSAVLEHQSDVEEPGAAILPPPPPPPPPPPRPPLTQGPAPSALPALHASQGITFAVQPSQMPPAPVPPPGPRPPVSIPGPRPPPGSPPRQSTNPSQRTLSHPLPPQQPPTLPACWPAAPPAAPHFQSSWSGAPSMDQHLSSGAPPGLNPPPPPPVPLPPPKSSLAPSVAPPVLPNGAGASETQGSKMQEHVVPAAPPSPSKHAHTPAQEPTRLSANAAPQAALESEPEATPAKNRGLQPSVVADQPADTSPGLDSKTGRDNNASEEDWWTTVTSSLPNLDGLMSPS
ncbi:probable SR-related and CTD-associated factor 8 at N-terminal half [Coccomyxa sp. Obi]|nr:probable SR-related and CTD-associated factor 8 at N-terminal half [Coccomyxa sp. Obi]